MTTVKSTDSTITATFVSNDPAVGGIFAVHKHHITVQGFQDSYLPIKSLLIKVAI